MHLPEDFSVSDLSALLTIVSDREMDEFNTMYDQLEAANVRIQTLEADAEIHTNNILAVTEQNEQLLAKYNILEGQCDQVYKNAELHLNSAKQARREQEQTFDKFALVKTQLAAYKEIGSPKKIRERIKDYQAKAVNNAAAIGKSKELIKGYRKEIVELIQMQDKFKASETQSNITTVWSENGDYLLLFPAKLTMAVNGTSEQQLTLLFMTGSGCAKLIGLNEEGLPAISAMPKGGLKPKAKTMQIAGEMLRKWKRQGWKVTTDDLDLAGK